MKKSLEEPQMRREKSCAERKPDIRGPEGQRTRRNDPNSGGARSDGRKEAARVSLAELCARLGISEATGRNWVRRGLLHPASGQPGRASRFTEREAARAERALAENRSGLLRSRRNKSRASGHGHFRGYLASGSPNEELVRIFLERWQRADGREDRGQETALRALAACARRLSEEAERTEAREELIRELEGDTRSVERTIPPEDPDFFVLPWKYIPGEDVLGCLYQSLRDLRERRPGGSYFTPPAVAGKAAESADPAATDGLILDPSCGSGQFLIRLPAEVDPARIRGCDIDPVAVRIARINLSLCRPEMTADHLRTQIVCGDFLAGAPGSPLPDGPFSVILGNPPWGASYSAEERRQLLEKYPELAGRRDRYSLPRLESADLFLAESLRRITPGGMLTFLLPESLLTVRSHRNIRQVLLEKSRIIQVSYLGNCFPGICCPVVLLTCRKEEKITRFMNTAGTVVSDVRRKDVPFFVIRKDRAFSSDRFPYHLTDEEWNLVLRLRAPEGKQYLAGHADFALGIVTGRNREMVLDHPEPGTEPVRRGADIFCFRMEEPSRFLRTGGEFLQQTAPEEKYRMPEKLVYRFISRTPVFALDRSGTRTLNSANILIPHLPGLPAAAVEAVLNSRVIRFLYERELRSLKLLRRHIEEFPLPVLRMEEAQEAAGAAESIRAVPAGSPVRRELYDELDRRIAEAYGLDGAQYDVLLRALGNDVPFL